MKLTRSVFPLILALVLVFSLGAGVFAADYPENGFSDVSRDAWYAKAIDFVKAEGLMNGTGGNRFEPSGAVTRAMVVTVLYRQMSEPDVKGMTCPFNDVPVGEWYFNAVIWAADAGVTTGKTANTFAPNEPITREQMAAMLIRFALGTADGKNLIEEAEARDPNGTVVLQLLRSGVDAAAVKELPGAKSFAGYKDADAISPYARWHVLFCSLTGIMNGNPDGTFRPGSPLTRAECAKVLMNLHEIGDSVFAQ